jgi:NADH-quinone oxidoreductase subunit N
VSVSATTIATLYYLVPEMTLVAAATLIYVMGAFCPKLFRPNLTAGGAILVAAAAAIWQDCRIGIAPSAEGFQHHILAGPITIDLFGHFARWAILLFGFLFVMLSAYSRTTRQTAEYVGSILLIVAGLMLAATGYDLVTLFVGLELVSIPTYVLLYLGRHDPSGQEATAKYFFLSILSSAFLLYGFSFLYGLCGSVRIDELHHFLQQASTAERAESATAPVYVKYLGPVAMLLVFAGLGFRMTAVPFHFYAPDVYQGTNHPNAGLLSTLTKIAGLLVLVRVVVAAMPGHDLQELGWQVALVLSVLTMTLGNVVALWQDNVRRLLAYSSIAHGGYMLIGVAVGFARWQSGPARDDVKVDGIGAALFYLAVYCLATIGAFAALNYLGSRERQIDGVDELSGLGRTRPLAALALAISLFSLAGVPPLAGFWGKLTLFAGALDVGAVQSAGAIRYWFIGLALAGVLNAAIAMAYYLRVVAVMYFRSPSATAAAEGGPGSWWAMVIAAVLVVAVGAYPGPTIERADQAGRTVRQFPPVERGSPSAVPVPEEALSSTR